MITDSSFFFFQRPDDHRDIHSFPTRRSSDLAVLTMVPTISTPGCPPHSAPTMETASDRKSTRLNSSHVAISYAVFCLKKKTTTKAAPTSLPQTTSSRISSNITQGAMTHDAAS